MSLGMIRFDTSGSEQWKEEWNTGDQRSSNGVSH